MKRLSIGVRLTVWYLAIFALGEVVFGLGMWLILRHNIYDMVDDDLENQVEDLQKFLRAQKNDATPSDLQAQVREVYSIEHSGDYLALYDEGGSIIFRSNFMQSHPAQLILPQKINRPISKSIKMEGHPFRFIYERLYVNNHVYTVEMGIPADDAFETLQLFRSYLLMFAPLLLLIAAGVGYWMSRRALAPVDALVRTARQVEGTNLSSRLQKLNTGDELQRLSDTLNEMLDRIETAFLRVTQFTADASHELRTPVSLIRTEAELALRRSRGEAEYKEALRHILLEAERTTGLIEQLLSLARADSGREIVNLQPLNLAQMLNGVVDGWQQVATMRSMQLSATIHEPSVFVMGDQPLLRRLADILLDNAFKYTPSPGSVRLALERNEDRAVMTVQDSGVGIAEEDQNKIFERFYRVDKARSRAQGGTGLGLAIAQWIVAQHHGSISVESRPGEGATFRVELPRIATPVPNPVPA
ncbi:MAG TPA: heavy metal sensor histidine kinase [Candidatus Sulfotelmatobacter sp.]|nr:heavy metal sensor histidine kinase [Candidatus Sulfotelmatobacter sp.]